MTNLTEARLAREAEICYASLALVTDYDCWRDATEPVSVEAVLAILSGKRAGARKDDARRRRPARPAGRGCRDAMRFGILTDRKAIPEEARRRLAPIAGRYLATAEIDLSARRRATRRHGLRGLRLPDDVSGPLRRAPDPRPDGAAFRLLPGRRDAPRRGRLRGEHRVRPRGPRRAAASLRDRRPGRGRIPGAARGRASTSRASGSARTSSRPPSSFRRTSIRIRSRRSTRARWLGRGTCRFAISPPRTALSS